MSYIRGSFVNFVIDFTIFVACSPLSSHGPPAAKSKCRAIQWSLKRLSGICRLVLSSMSFHVLTSANTQFWMNCESANFSNSLAFSFLPRNQALTDLDRHGSSEYERALYGMGPSCCESQWANISKISGSSCSKWTVTSWVVLHLSLK